MIAILYPLKMDKNLSETYSSIYESSLSAGSSGGHYSDGGDGVFRSKQQVANQFNKNIPAAKNGKVDKPTRKAINTSAKEMGIQGPSTVKASHEPEGEMIDEMKAPRMQKGAMAYDGPNKERSEAADRILAKTKAKRKKMKEEYVDEALGAAKIASAAKKMKITDAQKKALKAKISLTQGQKEVLGGRTTLGKAVRIGAGAGALIATGRSMEAGAQRKRDKEKKIKLGSPNYSTSDKYSSYNLKLDYTPEGEYVGEAKMKMKAKPKNLKDMSKGVGQAAPVDYRTLAQSYAPVGNIFNEKKMDPVGAEDKDIDNDGDHDKTDKYLLNRRKAIGKAIAKKRGKVKEGFSAWRIDLDFNEQVKK